MKISIIGCGAFGLAISKRFYNKNNEIHLWNKFPEEIDRLKREKSFMDTIIPNDYIFTTNLEECIKDCDLIVMALPTAFICETTIELKKYYNNQPIIIGSKGIEQRSGLFAIDIIKSIINTVDIGTISGGTFAVDMIKEKPMGFTVASTSTRLKEIIKSSLETEGLSIQYIDDTIGSELCGAYKNIVAIASGIINGLNYGDSTKYYLITKQMYDLERLIPLLGGNKETVYTYAGIDDIYMTCSSVSSRNFSFGNLIGKGNMEDINNYKEKTTIEGLYTTKSIYDLFNRKNIKSDFVIVMYEILYNNKDVDLLINYLKRN